MGLVIFGFMYCTQPDRNETDNTTATEQTAKTESAPKGDRLTPQFESELAEVVRKYGVNDGEGTFTLKTADVTLSTSVDSTSL